MKSKRRIDTDIEIAIVQIAMMIAGLDGNVSPEEYVVFEDILGLCGCAPERVKEVFDMGLESAGYVVLQSQRLPEDELIDVFDKISECWNRRITLNTLD